jgi:hypothetical protein
MSEQIERADMEQIHRDSASPEIDVSVRGGDAGADVEGAKQLQASLDEMADDFRMSGFKCVHQECGLVHNHDTTKHRGSDSFDMSEDEAAQMEMNSVCHCGLNQMAKEGVEGAPTRSKANSMAPIPDSAARHIDSL